MQQVFHVLAGVAPEADQAIRRPAAQVKPELGLQTLNGSPGG